MKTPDHILQEVAERTRGRDQADAPEDFAFIEGYSLAQSAARIAAFGAIRRAAEVAREHDRHADLCRNDEWEPFRDIEELQCARAIRRAIRAAIGSDKAS